MAKFTREDALEYHRLKGKPGKVAIVPTKPMDTQRDLSLAYSPGVAEPVLEIEKNAEDAYEYTSKGNLVAVVSNGTAILGLGDRGALASKPVMEGKGVLFKKFADIDVFDIELNSHDPDEIIKVVAAISPTFGGINLEDIKAPECFYIEEELKKMLDIPVFHDDQHGTAIISSAGLANALEIVGKKHEDIRLVISGAGASAISCAELAISWGVKRENIMLCDTRGVVYKGRKEGMNKYKDMLAVEDKGHRTLADAVEGADVFYGLSVANVLSPEMVKTMAADPIIFAMANPDPEIKPELAREARKDVIIATGRSDYVNQVNNVLGFPFIFRGALDVRAKGINEEMKFAASKALAALTKEDVPDSVIRAYGGKPIKFGREYIIRHCPGGTVAIDHPATARKFLRERKKPLAHPRLQGLAEILEPFLVAAPPLRPQEPLGRVHVDDEGQVGVAPDHQRVKLVHDAPQIATRQTLIHPRRIRETVGNDDLAGIERGLDRSFHVVAPCRGEQQDLRLRRPTVRVALEHEAPDLLGARAAAGLARQDDIAPVGAQRIGQKPRLRGLARTVDPFEADEHRPVSWRIRTWHGWTGCRRRS